MLSNRNDTLGCANLDNENRGLPGRCGCCRPVVSPCVSQATPDCPGAVATHQPTVSLESHTTVRPLVPRQPSENHGSDDVAARLLTVSTPLSKPCSRHSSRPFKSSRHRAWGTATAPLEDDVL